MLQSQPPFDPSLLKGGNVYGDIRASRQPISGQSGISDGGRQSHPTGGVANEVAEAGELADDLVAPIGAREGMHLVDNHIAEVTEDASHIVGAAHEHGLQGFRGDLENAAGLFQQLPLVRLSHVSVPAGDRDPRQIQ